MTRMLKRLALGAIAFLALCAATAVIAKRLLLVTVPCDQPCAGPVAACPPLQVGLELAESKTRVERAYTLWYKVQLKNDSCSPIGLQVHYPYSGLFTLHVWDSAGREVPRALDHHSSEFGSIIPYDDAEPEYSTLRKDAALRVDDSGFFSLPPGKQITASAPSVLRPHKLELVSVKSGSGLGSANASIPAELPISAPKPKVHEGYHALDEFVFEKPGRYRIQAEASATIGTQPLYRFDSKALFFGVARLLGIFVGIDVDRPYVAPDQMNRPIRAESPAVEFTVTR